jgi:hypothetical protein
MNILNRRLLGFGFALWFVVSLVKLKTWTEPRRIRGDPGGSQ